jgi:hypothetical protein
MKDAPNLEAPKGLKELENQPSLVTTKSILVRKFKWRVIPPQFEEGVRRTHLHKWLKAMRDEM